MEFDKSKILTVVTADQAKVGQKGWFAVLPEYIKESMSSGQEPSVLSNIDLDSPTPFTREGGYEWPLFYPTPEPTYRPFKNAEEFAPYRDRWVRIKDEADIYRVESYNGLEVEFSQAVLSFTEAFECCEFDDGTPFGVLEEGQDDQKRD